MAWQVPGFLPGDLVAAEDLSSRQFRLVRMASDNAVELADTEGGFAIGILLNAPAAGAAAAVEMAGISRLVAGEALVAGQFFGTDAQGRGRAVEATATGADLGDWILGTVVEGAGGAGGIATVKLLSPMHRVV